MAGEREWECYFVPLLYPQSLTPMSHTQTDVIADHIQESIPSAHLQDLVENQKMSFEKIAEELRISGWCDHCNTFGRLCTGQDSVIEDYDKQREAQLV